MSKSKKLVVFLLFSMIVFPSAFMLGSSRAEETLSVRLSFDQPFYHSDQRFAAIVTVKNESNKKVSNSNVRFYLGERLKLNKPRSLPAEPPKKPKYAYSWSKTFKPGETQLKLSKTIASTKLTEGTYPAWAVITKGNRVIAKKLSALVVVNPKAVSPLAVALVWNLHDGPHFDSNGVFIDDRIQKDCFSNSHSAGLYSIYLSSLNNHPNFKVSMNFTPLLLQQIQEISKGYRVKSNGKTIRIPKDSKDSANALQILSGFERLVKSGQVEMVPAPFSFPSLAYLIDQGWREDAVLQIEKGKDITQEVFKMPKKPAGIYMPELRLTSGVLPAAAESGTKYTVADETYSENLPKNNRDIYKPYNIQEGRNSKVTVFFADNFASSLISDTSDPEASVQLLLGVLAEIYLKNPENQKVIVISPNEPFFQPSADLLETLYTRIEQSQWLSPTNLDGASRLMLTDATPINLPVKEVKKPTPDSTYSRELARARKDLEQFKSMTVKTHPLENKLENFLLIAQASDFLERGNSQQENLGSGFVQRIQKEIQTELHKIQMPKKQTITLTSSRGKIPVPINNTSSYAFKITMTAESSGLTFPAGNSKTILLRPKENLFTLPITTKTSAPQEIKVTLHYEDYAIATGYLTIKSMYFNLTVLIILGLLLLAVGLPFAWRYVKSR